MCVHDLGSGLFRPPRYTISLHDVKIRKFFHFQCSRRSCHSTNYHCGMLLIIYRYDKRDEKMYTNNIYYMYYLYV